MTPPLRGSHNMAIDEALMRRAQATGEAVLRLYGWCCPTLSLGRHQPARGWYDLARAHTLGVDIVRRPTGGRAVLHHREVTYSVTAPVGLLGSLWEAYATINRLLLDGLRRLGVDACEAAPSGAPPRPGTAPCFETPVTGELVVAGRKLVGSAQWREAGALLQHGSILVDDDQWLITSLLAVPRPPPPPPATLRQLLGRVPTTREVADALTSALAAAGTGRLAPMGLESSLRGAARVARARYEDDAWTWRR